MVGVDISLRPPIWACLSRGKWACGVLGEARARSLGDALAASGVRERDVALAVPLRDVRMGTMPDSVKGGRARRAALLAACQQLGAGPRDVAVSVSPGPRGAGYAAALREAVEAWEAAWKDGRFRVRVVEPAAASLLRALAAEDTGLVVSAGEGQLELVIGSRWAYVHGRVVEAPWESNPAVARLEVEETLAAAASRHNVEIGWMAVCGRGPIDTLARALAGIAPRRDLRDARLPGAESLPPEAVAAASVALWDRGARARASTGGAGRHGMAWKLGGIGRGRATQSAGA